MAAVIAFALREPWPTAVGAAWAAAAGTCGAVGLAALYRGLAAGRMGVVAPISGVLAAAIPVAVGMATAGAPGPLRLVGFAVGLVAVVLVSAAGGQGGGDVRGALLLALAAGAALGGYNVAISRVDPGSTFASLAASRSVAVLVTLVLAGLARAHLAPRRSVLPLLLLVGCLDMGGNALYVVATHLGRLDVAALLSSLYPVSTVVLATVLLHERMTRGQVVGIVGAGVAIALIVGG